MIVPLILCGGSGTRLWPLSRKSYPKQFAPLGRDGSLFQEALARLSGPDFAPPVVVTGSDFRFIVTEQMEEAGIAPGAILIEPMARNTAPAILAATLHIAAADPQALILVAPSDHLIPDPDAFRAAVATAMPAARDGRIVTFGVTPTRAETGYGWLDIDPASEGPVRRLRGFVEKPDPVRAAALLASGNHAWNAGIFLFSAATLIAAFETLAPEFLAPVRGALSGAAEDLGFTRLAPGHWIRAPDLSIDYAIMERAEGLAVVALPGAWSDLGDWQAVWRETGPDAHGVAASGAVTAIGCEDSLLRAEGEGLHLVGLGLRDIVVVAMPDAVLVADRARSQEVREAVARMSARKVRQAETFPRDHRPWGWFETLALGDRFQVKRIVVHPGGSLSLQSHMHRAEHWIVVEGTARVTVEGEVRLVTENQSIYIPVGAKHRMENPGKLDMVLIEVQTGGYLGEDDITRFDDAYARGQGPKG